MEDEAYRLEFERRMKGARDLRRDIRSRMLELQQQYEEMDRRVRAMEEHYRFEFRKEPPAAEDEPEAVTARPPRARRVSRPGQPSWREAIVATLAEAGGPLHVKDIWSRMQEGGFETESADPVRSIVSTAIRMDEVRRAGPNTFTLSDARGGSQESLSITAAGA